LHVNFYIAALCNLAVLNAVMY